MKTLYQSIPKFCARTVRKTGTILLVGVYAFTHIVAAHAMELTFWEERRVARSGKTSSALPSPLFNAMPDPVDPLESKNVSEASPSTLECVPSAPHLLDVVLPHASVQECLPPRAKGPLVVLIQDVHTDATAQKNIGRVLVSLTEAGINTAGVEGASGPLELEAMRHHPSPEDLFLMADYFRDRGYLSGPEWGGVVSSAPVRLIGVEDPALYESNLMAARESLSRSAEVGTFLSRLRKDIAGVKDKKFPQNLKSLDLKRAAYLEGTIGLADYTRFLAEGLGRKTPSSLNTFVWVAERERRLNERRIELERVSLMEQLSVRLDPSAMKGLVEKGIAYREGRLPLMDFYRHLRSLCLQFGVRWNAFPAFRNYVDYVQTVESIDRGQFLEDLDNAAEALAQRWAHTPAQRELWLLAEDAALLDHLLQNQMTSTEWVRYEARRGAVLALGSRLREAEAGEEESLDVAALVPPHEAFCRLAFQRNGAIAERVLALAAEEKLDQLALVVGGFHTMGLLEIFKRRGAGAVVITPRVGKIQGHPLDVFARDPLPLERLFAGAPVRLAPEKLLAMPKNLSPEGKTRAAGLLLGLAAGSNVLAAAKDVSVSELTTWTQSLPGLSEANVQVERKNSKITAQVSLTQNGEQRTVTAETLPKSVPRSSGDLESVPLPNGEKMVLAATPQSLVHQPLAPLVGRGPRWGIAALGTWAYVFLTVTFIPWVEEMVFRNGVYGDAFSGVLIGLATVLGLDPGIAVPWVQHFISIPGLALAHRIVNRESWGVTAVRVLPFAILTGLFFIGGDQGVHVIFHGLWNLVAVLILLNLKEREPRAAGWIPVLSLFGGGPVPEQGTAQLATGPGDVDDSNNDRQRKTLRLLDEALSPWVAVQSLQREADSLFNHGAVFSVEGEGAQTVLRLQLRYKPDLVLVSPLIRKSTRPTVRVLILPDQPPVLLVEAGESVLAFRGEAPKDLGSEKEWRLPLAGRFRSLAEAVAEAAPAKPSSVFSSVVAIARSSTVDASRGSEPLRKILRLEEVLEKHRRQESNPDVWNALPRQGGLVSVDVSGRTPRVVLRLLSGKAVVFASGELGSESQRVSGRWVPDWGPVLLFENTVTGRTVVFGVDGIQVGTKGDFLSVYKDRRETDRRLRRDLLFRRALFETAAILDGSGGGGWTSALNSSVWALVPLSGVYAFYYARRAESGLFSRRQMKIRVPPGPQSFYFLIHPLLGPLLTSKSYVENKKIYFSLSDSGRNGGRGVSGNQLDALAQKKAELLWAALWDESARPGFLLEAVEPLSSVERRGNFNNAQVVLTSDAHGRLVWGSPWGGGERGIVRTPSGSVAPNRPHRLWVYWVRGGGYLLIARPAGGRATSVFGWGGGYQAMARGEKTAELTTLLTAEDLDGSKILRLVEKSDVLRLRSIRLPGGPRGVLLTNGLVRKHNARPQGERSVYVANRGRVRVEDGFGGGNVDLMVPDSMEGPFSLDLEASSDFGWRAVLRSLSERDVPRRLVFEDLWRPLTESVGKEPISLFPLDSLPKNESPALLVPDASLLSSLEKTVGEVVGGSAHVYLLPLWSGKSAYLPGSEKSFDVLVSLEAKRQKETIPLDSWRDDIVIEMRKRLMSGSNDAVHRTETGFVLFRNNGQLRSVRVHLLIGTPWKAFLSWAEMSLEKMQEELTNGKLLSGAEALARLRIVQQVAYYVSDQEHKNWRTFLPFPDRPKIPLQDFTTAFYGPVFQNRVKTLSQRIAELETLPGNGHPLFRLRAEVFAPKTRTPQSLIDRPLSRLSSWGTRGRALYGVLTVGVVPVVEEFLFRHLVFHGEGLPMLLSGLIPFEPLTGFLIPWVVSVGVFVWAHRWGNPDETMDTTLDRILPAVLFTVTYLLCPGELWNVALHALWNAAAVATEKIPVMSVAGLKKSPESNTLTSQEFVGMLEVATDPNRFSAPADREAGWVNKIAQSYIPPLHKPLVSSFGFQVGKVRLEGTVPRAPLGEFEFRLGGKDLWPPLLFVSHRESGKTWAYSLEAFRQARSKNKRVSATLLRAPFDQLETAEREAPQWVRLSHWLAERRTNPKTPALERLELPASLNGKTVGRLSLKDLSTGQRLIGLNPDKFLPSAATLVLEGDSLFLIQEARGRVCFKVADIVAQWGNKVYRSPENLTAPPFQRVHQRDLRKKMGDLLPFLLTLDGGALNLPLAKALNDYNRTAVELESDSSGYIHIVFPAEVSKVFGFDSPFGIKGKKLRPHHKYIPRILYVPQRGPLLCFVDKEKTDVLHAFSFGGLFRQKRNGWRKGLVSFGVFETEEQIIEAARLDLSSLLEESWRLNTPEEKRLPPGGESLLEKGKQQRRIVGPFDNEADVLSLESAFHGWSIRFQTQGKFGSARRLFLVPSSAGPWLVGQSQDDKDPYPWVGYGPLTFEDTLVESVPISLKMEKKLEWPEIEQRLAVLSEDEAFLSSGRAKRAAALSFARGDEGTGPTVQQVWDLMRREIRPWLTRWRAADETQRQSLFLDLMADYLSVFRNGGGPERYVPGKRNGLLLAEFLFNGESPERLAKKHRKILTVEESLLRETLKKRYDLMTERGKFIKLWTYLLALKDSKKIKTEIPYLNFCRGMDQLSRPAPVSVQSLADKILSPLKNNGKWGEWTYLLLTVGAVPFLEELLFRHLVFTPQGLPNLLSLLIPFEPISGVLIPWAVSVGVFVWAHRLFNKNESAETTIDRIFPALVFTFAYVLSPGDWWNTALHALWNAGVLATGRGPIMSTLNVFRRETTAFPKNDGVDRRRWADALVHLAPRPFEGVPRLETLTWKNWTEGTPSDTQIPLTEWRSLAEGAFVSEEINRVDVGAAARSAASKDDRNMSGLPVEARGTVRAYQAHNDVSSAARFVSLYNAYRSLLWRFRLVRADLETPSIKVIDLTPLFAAERQNERGALEALLTLLSSVKPQGPVHLLVENPMAAKDVEKILNERFPGGIGQGRLWIKGDPKTGRIFQPEGLSLEVLRESQTLSMRVYGVDLQRVIPSERPRLVDWSVTLIPLELLVSREIDQALRALAFLKIQA